MGTTYSITVVDADPSRVDPGEITSVLAAIENSMSTYQPDSELMRINVMMPGNWITISEPLYAVLTISEEVSLLTKGAFDITISPLVNLWGFGPDLNVNERVPDLSEISELMKTVGYHHLELAEDQNEVKKTLAIQLDLSGVAKGYAVDQIAYLLEEYGITNYLVEIGGEVKTHGLNADGENWRIGIEVPEFSGEIVQRGITVGNIGMATSGDYRNYFEIEGSRYSHIIDPRSGQSISHNLASVTVLAESTARADALATAFMVLGAEEALALANQNNIAAFFLAKGENGFSEEFSRAFEEYLED